MAETSQLGLDSNGGLSVAGSWGTRANMRVAHMVPVRWPRGLLETRVDVCGQLPGVQPAADRSWALRRREARGRAMSNPDEGDPWGGRSPFIRGESTGSPGLGVGVARLWK